MAETTKENKKLINMGYNIGDKVQWRDGLAIVLEIHEREANPMLTIRPIGRKKRIVYKHEVSHIPHRVWTIYDKKGLPVTDVRPSFDENEIKRALRTLKLLGKDKGYHIRESTLTIYKSSTHD